MAVKRPYEEGEYTPYDSSGNDYAGMVGMSDLDRAALEAATQSWYSADTPEKKAAAHEQAENIRRKYGYSGGTDGSQYLPSGNSQYKAKTPSVQAPERQAFTYESAPQYTDMYRSRIDELSRQILGREAFSYDPETDPQYAAYRKEYRREGQRAAADAMGQYAAMTGGMPSTAAVAASQQAGDYYAAQMADKIPELYRLAYQMYRDEGTNQRENLDMLRSLEQGDYAKYLDALSQYNTDRNFAYGQYMDDRNADYQQYRDAVGDERYANEWDYGLYRDTVNDSRYTDELLYDREQDRLNREYQAQRDALEDEWREREFNYGASRDAAEDEWRQREWDYNVGRDTLEDEWRQREWDYNVGQDALDRAAAAAAAARSSGSSSGGSGSASGGSGSTDEAEEESALDALLAIEDRNEAQKYALENAGSQWKTDGWMNLWDAQHGGDTAEEADAEEGGAKIIPTNYVAAIQRGKQLGLSDDELQEILNGAQWQEAKDAYRNGDRSRPAGQYETYQDYLAAIFGAIGG